MKKLVRIVMILVLAAGMAALVVKHKKQAQTVKPYGLRPLSVHGVEAQSRSLTSGHSYLGSVEAWQTARVSSRLSARIDKVVCDEGDQVKAGQLLMQLDDSDIQLQLKSIEATIKSLKSNQEFWIAEDQRDSQLTKEGVITQVEAEVTHNRMVEATAKLNAACQDRDRLTRQLDYTRLTSPFDGRVTTRSVDPGDLATPGQALMVVEDHSALKIAFEAPQEDLSFLKTGLPVRAKLGPETIPLTITHMYPSLNHKRMIRVEVKAGPEWASRTGAFVPLEVIWRQHENAVAIPQECLMRREAGDQLVFRIVEDQLQLVPVEVVMESDGWVEVKGVQAGDQIVSTTFLGWAKLAEGLKVEVVQ